MSSSGQEKQLLDVIGPWSEVKLEILRQYAQAYSQILSNQPLLQHVYVDAFAGAGRHISKTSGALVSGSPEIALGIVPPFYEYHFIDSDNQKIPLLENLARERENVFVYHGDCNRVIVESVIARLRYDQYRRCLCILDPYGMDLHWQTVEKLAQLGSTELFMNFPVMDINRNALRNDPSKIEVDQADRMTRFWGDSSWRVELYRERAQRSLWGDPITEKGASNEIVVSRYVERLKNIAGFNYVAAPLPMRNSSNAIVYYLLFASHKPLARKIMDAVFRKFR